MVLLKLYGVLVFLEIVCGSLNSTEHSIDSIAKSGVVPSSIKSSENAANAVILSINKTGSTTTDVILSSRLHDNNVSVVESAVKAYENVNSTIGGSNNKSSKKKVHKVLIYDPESNFNRLKMLRAGPIKIKNKSKKHIAIQCILYQEFDEVNRTELLNEHFMYNLDDVALFFEIYLDTRVCYGSCD